MRRSVWFAGTLGTLVLSGAGLGAAEPGAYVERQGDAVRLGNASLEITFNAGGVLTEVRNKLSNRLVPVREDDFAIEVTGSGEVGRQQFAFQGLREGAFEGGRSLSLDYALEGLGLKLAVVCELRDRDFLLRRRLELTCAKPLELGRVEVWGLGLGGTCTHQGFGNPVFLEDLFLGLEYPGAHNTFAAGTASLIQFPGRTVQERFVSQTAVLGVAEAGAVTRRFRRYVESFQVTPRDAVLFVNYNTWWTLMPPTEENALAMVRLFKEKLYEPYGESFDTFTLDDGWDDKDSLWQIRADRFPHGFGPLVEALRGMNANLGIWLSPSSGYNHAPWGAKNGYERNSNEWFLCQSGPKYRRDIRQVVTDLARAYDVAFFKFDGFCADCSAEGHGHLPGDFAREANIDAYIELLTAVRQARPGIFLDPTCGIWLSPWWLRYADSLWGSVSGDYPDAIVPAPIVRDSATTTRDAVFRQRCREYPGYPPAAIEHLGIIVISDEKWEDNAMAVVGRGCRLLTLYINPVFFRKGDQDWAFLAALLKWVRRNSTTLTQTELLGGDPFRREVYGFAHAGANDAIVSLRNPFIEPRSFTLRLDQSIGWSMPPAEPLLLESIYPRRETLAVGLRAGDARELQLSGYEQLVLRLRPAPTQDAFLTGVRGQETERAGNRLTYTVQGLPGNLVSVALSASRQPTKVWVDGQQAEFAPGADRTTIPVRFPGDEPGRAAIETVVLAPGPAPGPLRIEGRAVVTVPAAAAAKVHLLFDPARGTALGMACTARVNGQPQAVRTVEMPTGGQQAHLPHDWIWFEFDLAPGRNQVEVSLTPKSEVTYVRGEVGWWLWLEQPLARRALAIEFDQALAPASAEPLPVPIGQGSTRTLLTLAKPAVLRLGSRWPAEARTQAAVWLDEVAPDEVTQEWGKLQKNQSVWEKEMIVAGRRFSHGLGTHANGRLSYELEGGGFERFRCLVGRDEHAGDGRIEFEVWVDGNRVFASGAMTRASPALAVAVDLAGAKTLELRTLDSGDGINGDHGNWADAQLLR